MKFLTLGTRLLPALIVAFTLSACGGGSGGGGFLPGTPNPPAPTTPPDTGVKPEMRCAR